MKRSPSTARSGKRAVRSLWRSVTAVSLLSGGALAALTSLAAPAAQATTFTVTTTADSGPGSLRQALSSAASGDTITFATGVTGTIDLESILPISTNVTISGPGASALAVSGQSSTNDFAVGLGVTATISGLTIENGSGETGGGISNEGSLTATDDVFSDNGASLGGAIGDCFPVVGGPEMTATTTACEFTAGPIAGPISSSLAPRPSLTVTNDTFSGNTASMDGGAIYNVQDSSLVATGDLFESNQAASWGGAIYNCQACNVTSGFQPAESSGDTAGLGLPEATATVTNSTFWDNVAFETGAGIYTTEGSTSVITSTFATNTPDAVADGGETGTTRLLGSILAASGPLVDPACQGGGIVDAGYNVDDDGSCGFSAPSLSDQADSAIFGPSPAPQLASNGGPTQTVALPAVSVAASLVPTCTGIGLPTNSSGLPTDQRGYSRPVANCSAGAYQVNGTPPAPPGGGTGTLVPSPPVDLTGTDGQITLQWGAPVFQGSSPVTSYEVFRFTANTAAVLLATVAAPGTSYVDSNVTAGVTYSYYVEAVNAFGTSAPSNVVSVTAPAGPTGPCSSYSGNAAFVCALYEDILGRAPDAPGLSYWQSQLASGVTGTQVAYAIATSNEYQTDYIEADYQAFLGRPADAGGLSTWLSAFAAGATDEQVDAGILGSPEFFTDAGGTNNGFINAVYQDLLGRPADPGGLSTWSSALNSGATRTQVAYAIDTSNESRTDTIQFFYQTLLNRPADPGGLATWLGALNSGATDEQVLAGIAGSPEFYSDATGA